MMGQQKHTPGPWEYSGGTDDRQTLVCRDGYPVVHCHGRPGAPYPERLVEADANAAYVKDGLDALAGVTDPTALRAKLEELRTTRACDVSTILRIVLDLTAMLPPASACDEQAPAAFDRST